MSDKGTGKTTRLMEEAVRALGVLPQGTYVYITGAHTKWLKELEHQFKTEGLVDVIFVPASSIMNGYLRGRDGILLIDDTRDLSINMLDCLLDYQRKLNDRMKFKEKILWE